MIIMSTATAGSFLYALMLLMTGCGCFLIGINLMSRGFVRLCEGKNSSFLRLFQVRNRFEGVGTGILHSTLTQSSDATTVFSLKLLNSGYITLFQTACIIVGANVGTTLTGFLISLSATDFDFNSYFAFCAFIGAIPLLSNNRKSKIFGEIVGGFGLLFVGINLLDLYLQDTIIKTAITNLFSYFNIPFLLIIVGLVITAIFQSSSVSTGIVIFMVGSGMIGLRNALYIVMGANIGTCITGLIAVRGGTTNMKRAALVHVLFNILGTLIFSSILLFAGEWFMGLFNNINANDGFKVALFHLLFNVTTVIVILPFIKPMVLLTAKMVSNE